MSHGQVFVLAMIAIITCGSLVKMSIRTRAGHAPAGRSDHWNPLCSKGGSGEDLAAERRIALLSDENEKLHRQISRLEERLAVLERIATDPAERVSREIDALR